MIKQNEILVKPKELMIERIVSKEENRYGEEVYLLYNPVGYGGVLTAGEKIVNLIKAFDGKKDVGTVLKESTLTNEEVDTANAIIEALVNKQMLESKQFVLEKTHWPKELTCWLHITNDCNLRCKYCYIHKSHCSMPNDIIYESIDKMLESCRRNNYSTLSLMLVGGEPLMRFDVIKNIVEYCTKNKGDIKVRYIIPTNGTLITPEIADYIVKNNISVGVSIDGIEEYHDKNRIKANGSGSYKLAMQGIDNLIERGVKPSIMVTVTEDNLPGLPELTKAMIEKKIFFRFSFERDTGTGNPAVIKNEEYCVEILKECFKIMREALLKGEIGWLFQFGDVTFSRPVRRACAAGKNFFAIGQDGSIGSCSLGLECTRSNISKITDVITDIEEIFADISRTSACDVDECKKCVWRHSCAGACPWQTYATYKTFLHTSPYCSLYKACLPEVIRVLAMIVYYNNKKEC